MIFFIHILAGVVIASTIKIVWLALPIAFLSHYLLDAIPHGDYSLNNIKDRKWKSSTLEFLKLALDLSIGVLIILFVSFSKDTNIILLIAATLSALLPDIMNVLWWVFPKNGVLKSIFKFHNEIHYKENKKIFFVTKIFIQYVVVLLLFGLLL